MSEPIASDPGGKMPGPSGWLKRAAWSTGRLGRRSGLRRAPAGRSSDSVWANRMLQSDRERL